MSHNRPPLTPKLSAQARRELGLSQNDVIKATGIQAYKLKQYESRHIQIELSDVKKLTDFYASQGVDLVELGEHMAQADSAERNKQVAAQSHEALPAPALKPGYTHTPRPGFFISDQLSSEVVDQLMIQMEVNDDRVAELIADPYETGLFGGPTGATEARIRELFGALAQNHLIFRVLQGRSIVAPNLNEPEPKTVGGFLSQWVLQSEAAPLFAGDQDDKRPKKKAAATAPVTAAEE